jgi:hypothetical protein
MKNFNLMFNVGKIKYLVNYHDGIKTHKDNSPFYDIATFRNKKKRDLFVKELLRQGYTERSFIM